MPVRLDAGAELEAHAGVGGQQRQHGVRRRGGPGGVTAQRPEHVAAERVERLERALVVQCRPRDLRGQLGWRAFGVEPVGLAPDVDEERAEAVGKVGDRELVAQHRRERQRDLRRLFEHVEQWQVRGRHRLPQPLLAERPRAVALDVRHVGVEDYCERHTARKSSAPSSAGRSAKSRTEIAGTNQS
jgi:hypothetical protein